MCMFECLSLPVRECMSVGPWSLSVDLNQPSPVLFARDMPQETLCLSVLLYTYPMESVWITPPRQPFLSKYLSGVEPGD